MASIGLVFIIGSWLIQLFYLSQKDYKIQTNFVGLYCLGVLILVIDAYQSGSTEISLLNLLSLIVSGLVLLSLRKGRKK